jgi:peptide-methionine (R)-S-oxide reductase
MARRAMLLGSAGAIAMISLFRWGAQSDAAPGEKFEIEKSDEEWRRSLTPAQYEILRKHGTERAGSSPLHRDKRMGTFACAGCDLPLFSSETKFESGTGWPSFWQPLPNAVGTSTDKAFFTTRTEVHCRRCGGHLGHVFEDGPKPTGLRYCMNGLSLKFVPGAAAGPALVRRLSSRPGEAQHRASRDPSCNQSLAEIMGPGSPSLTLGRPG